MYDRQWAIKHGAIPTEDLDTEFLKYIPNNVFAVYNPEGLKANNKMVFSGKAPSINKCHLGHYALWCTIKQYIQKNNCRMLFQISDDEKYIAENISLQHIKNLKTDVLNGLGKIFSSQDLYIFNNISQSIATLYPYTLDLVKSLKLNTLLSLHGKTVEYPTLFYSPFQGSVCLYLAKQGITPIIFTAVDEFTHFILINKYLKKHKLPLISVIFANYVPGLNGATKMSGRYPLSCLEIDVDLNTSKKIKNALTGAESTLEEHAIKGIDTSKDYLYQYCEILKILPIERELYKTGKIGSVYFKKLFEKEYISYFKNINSTNLVIKILPTVF